MPNFSPNARSDAGRTTVSKTVKIGDRLVGEGQPPYIIAEACINHQGDVEIAKKMTYVAKNTSRAIKDQNMNNAYWNLLNHMPKS